MYVNAYFCLYLLKMIYTIHNPEETILSASITNNTTQKIFNSNTGQH